MSPEVGLFEAIHSMRAMRYLKPDPVPDELVTKVLEAATQAPNDHNMQPWRFVVLRDPALKAKVAEYYNLALRDFPSQAPPMPPPPWPVSDGARQRMGDAIRHLAANMAEAPVLILVCSVDPEHMPPSLREISHYGSIFPAVQNLLLAARGCGLGAALTALHKLRELEMKALLGIPDDADTICLIALGYPDRPFGPVDRQPVADVTYYDGWGRTQP